MRTLLLLLLGLAACARTSAPSTAAPAAATGAGAAQVVGSDDDCTLATPLVPGRPGSPGHLLPSPINPNGQSELAALMRTFVEDLRAARAALARGQRGPALWPRHRRLRCAWPTATGDRDAAFDGRAQTYLAALRAFDEAPDGPAYDGVLRACRACHEVSCSGPLRLIDGLGRRP